MIKKVFAWVDERFPLDEMIKHELTEYPVPRNLNYMWSFGFLAMFVLIIQLVSGIFLAMHYKADVGMAFDSIQHIMREVNYGWLIRYLHSTGASAFFALIFIHIGRTLYYGSYRRPRELLWWTGLLLLLLLMATAFMGYLLPWGQMSFWGAQVITALFGVTPFIGDEVVIWLRGDFVVGDATLTRFFALHYLFPFIICAAVAIHLVALHWVKSSNPSGITLHAKDNIPFHPYFTIKDLFGLGVFLIIFFGFVFFSPEFWIMPENNVPANPMVTPPHIVPEWYFLPFYAILRSIPDPLGGVVAMAMSILIFLAMPWLDRSNVPGGAKFRPGYRIMVYVWFFDLMLLGYVGAQAPEGIFILLGRIATFIYFGLFLLLPFISKREERRSRVEGLPHEAEKLIREEQEELLRSEHYLRREDDQQKLKDIRKRLEDES
ncbi:MAG TPA: cytochrome b/b6 [Candidatus Tenderia electrophaga]|uniref:Cytochrome b n=1 Tax=Candidatus Tenderia electrophaga TaxID=1748243 RepID=A0A832N3Y9_9GAMM|nr:cytochrome b/b6 [Candidatus Tenderia electrophaga]